MAEKIDANLINIASSLLVACQEVLALGTVTEANRSDAKSAGSKLNQAAKALRTLNDAVKDLDEKGKKLGEANNASEANNAINEIKKVINIVDQPSERPNDLKELFDNVSTSLINAQKSLNKTSLEYAAELDPRLPQTLYGIPSVKAEMKVGFNEIKAKGINLILFTSSTQKQRYSESTVSFEVVGSPPPPGPASYGDYLVPIPRFIVTGTKREELLNALVASKNITEAQFLNNKHLAVIVLYEPLPEEKPKPEWNYYVVLWPGRTKDDQVEDNWLRWLFLNMAQDPDGKLHFIDDQNVASIFEPPQPEGGMLEITRSTKTSLAKNFTVEQLAMLVIQLCDALMRTNMTVRFWLDSVRIKVPKSLNP